MNLKNGCRSNMEKSLPEMPSGRPIGIIIQARMGSERLPGKVLKKLPDGEPVLRWVTERCLKSAQCQNVVVATTLSPKDDEVIRFCDQFRYLSFRGSETDVLGRYLACAEHYSLDALVRVTADCPFIAPEVIDQCVAKFRNGGFDYVNNSRTSKTFPRGLDVEVFSLDALKQAAKLAVKDYQREHVTIVFYENPDFFRIGAVRADPDFYGPELRLTVDTAEDFAFVSEVITRLHPSSYAVNSVAIIELLRKHPEIGRINQSVQQKPIEGRII